MKRYALPLPVGGLAISIWHYLVQLYPRLEGGACDVSVPCSARYVEVFGLVSIPFVVGAGFIVITVLLGLYVRASGGASVRSAWRDAHSPSTLARLPTILPWARWLPLLVVRLGRQ